MKNTCIIAVLMLTTAIQAQVQPFFETSIHTPYGIHRKKDGGNPTIKYYESTRGGYGFETNVGIVNKKRIIKIGYERTYLWQNLYAGKASMRTYRQPSNVGADTLGYYQYLNSDNYITYNVLNRIPLTYSSLFSALGKGYNLNFTLGVALPLRSSDFRANVHNENDKTEVFREYMEHGMSIIGGFQLQKSNKKQNINYYCTFQSEYITSSFHYYNKIHWGYDNFRFEANSIYLKLKMGVRFNLNKKIN